MKIEIQNTTKIVEVNGVPARVWEGQTESGIKVHCFVTRIAIDESEPEKVKEIFAKELQEVKKPSAGVQAYPLRLVL